MSTGVRTTVVASAAVLCAAAMASFAPAMPAFAQDAPAKAATKAEPKASKAAPKAAAKNADEDGAPAAAPAKRRDPAEAQRQIDNAIKLLQSGKNEPAIQTISAAIAGGNLPAAVMARGLYHRGIAYRRTQKPAQAISDFTSALWLKGGLADQDRADAMEQRSAAYREAGLPDQGTDSKSARAAAPAGKTAEEHATTQPAVRAASAKTAVAPSASPAQQPAPASKTSSPPAPTWSAKTEVKGRTGEPQATASPVTTASAATAAKGAQPATPAAQGRFGARVALVRTKQEADALVARLKKEFGAALEAREPEVVPVTFGGMGSFFQVRVAPFATQEAAQTACTRLKGPGLDCVAVTR